MKKELENEEKKVSKSNWKATLKEIFWPTPEETYHFELSSDIPSSQVEKGEQSKEEIQKENDKLFEVKDIFPSLDVTIEYLKVKYNMMINSDVVSREFTLTARNKQYKALLFFIDGMVDSQLMDNNVLRPLMMRNRANTYDGAQTQVVSEAVTNNISVKRVKKFDLEEYILDCLLPQNNVKKVSTFEEAFDGVNMGNCLLFVDTLGVAFNIDIKGFKQRGIEPPNNEIVIRGPQEAFTEVIRTNTSLIRRTVNNENLVIESLSVGKISKTKCAVCYVKNIANNDLVAEVKYRLNNLDIDYITSSGQLEQLIEDDGNYSLPQMIATERPDHVSDLLLGGRVAVIVNGAPYVLVMPGIFTDFLSTPEDKNTKFQYSNLLKIIRVIAIIITIFLPAFYIAITNFHQELIPTKLLLTIVASRAGVPFPIIVELIVMEISFELIREGGLRVPSPIGPTIGIVGALILGQSAVEAGIVSPILIIIVSLTGIASFCVPDYSLGFHCRIVRFGYIFLAYLAGFLGIAFGICVHLFILSSMKSFGVSYLEPYVPVNVKGSEGVLIAPAWKREKREGFLKPKKNKRQSDISMNWK